MGNAASDMGQMAGGNGGMENIGSRSTENGRLSNSASTSTSEQSKRKNVRGQISDQLTRFSDRLVPSEKFGEDGTQKVENVIGAFKRTRAYSIDRVYYGGSVGKKTFVIFPDFDCVMFINNTGEPPLDAVLDRFETFLRDNYSQLEIDLDSIHKKSVTVSFEFTNGMEVDLLAGCNFSQDKLEQRRIVLEKMRNLADKRRCYYYGSSLAETQINFVKTRTSFCHQLIRLAKYWFKSLSFGENVFGGSAMMEMICAVVVENGYSDMIDAFKSFLKLIRGIATLKIAFYQDYESRGDWELLSANDLKSAKYRSYYDPAILAREYFVMEPSSPYNDLAESLNEAIIEKLGHFADIMLGRITELESPVSNRMKTLSPNAFPQIHYDQFFQPFPMRLLDVHYHTGMPTHILINYTFRPYNSPNCKIDENKVNFFEGNPEAKKVTQTISNNLLFLIRARANKVNVSEAYTVGLANISFGDAKDAVAAFTNENFVTPNYVEESDDQRSHKTYDVTLYVPYRCAGNTYAVQISLKGFGGGSCNVM